MQKISQSLLSNFYSLGFLKVTDALVLVIIIPVIISRIGIANYGIIALVQVFLNYGKTIIDYGFNITGVRQTALSRSEGNQLSRIFNYILYTRILICTLIMSLLFLLVELIPYLYQNAEVFYWGFFLLIGHSLFTDWFFIGIKQTKFIAQANLAAKLLYAASIFIFINTPTDTKYVLALQGISALLTGFFVLSFIASRFKIKLLPPRWAPVKAYLHDDFKLLLTNLSIEFNTSYSILILNILTTDALTGYYSIMQKLVQPVRFLLVIFSQTIFPVVCEKTKEGWIQVKSFLRTTFSVFFTLPLSLVVGLALFAKPVLDYFTGGISQDMVLYFRLFLMVPIIILLNIPAYQILLAYEHKSDYTLVYLISMCINVVLAYILTLQFNLIGLIWSVLIVELFITLGLYWMVWRNSPGSK